jgi:AraC-like DNA-binding protein
LEDSLNLFWIDLRVDQTSPPAQDALREYFVVKDCGYTESIGAELQSGRPDALFLDFDYPDRSGLRLLQQLKLRYPSMPILMGTVQHSEELAVWAFRSGALDYFVKPVPEEELRRCHARLAQIRQHKRRQKSRNASLGNADLPLEAAPVQTTDKRALAPALHYVSQNFRDKIRRDEAAALCAMTPFQFSRRFREACGVPFRDYVVQHRIREACRLLENPSASITGVALAVGFNDVGYFSRMFKQYLGITPSAMKAACRSGGAAAAQRRAAHELAAAVDLVPEDTDNRLRALPPLPVN